MLITPQLFF